MRVALEREREHTVVRDAREHERKKCTRTCTVVEDARGHEHEYLHQRLQRLESRLDENVSPKQEKVQIYTRRGPTTWALNLELASSRAN